MNVETQRGIKRPSWPGISLRSPEHLGRAEPVYRSGSSQTAPPTETTTPALCSRALQRRRITRWCGGVGAGSQIRRDKLFWFAALDSYRRNDPGLASVKHPDEFFAQPSNDQMQVLSARLGLSSSNPVAEGLAAYSNLCKRSTGCLGPLRRGFAVGRIQSHRLGKLPSVIASRLKALAQHGTRPAEADARLGNVRCQQLRIASSASEELLLARWEAFLTPNLLAISQGSMGRNLLSARPEAPSAFEQTFLTPSVWGQLPQIVVDNRYGFTIGNPSRFGQGSYPDEKLYQAQESVDWVTR